MYISFNLEPSKSHVGGAWYSDQALDVGFIHTISKVIEKLLADSPEGLKLSSITQKVNEYKCSTIHIFLKNKWIYEIFFNYSFTINWWRY